jgi:hypothetical protein
MAAKLKNDAIVENDLIEYLASTSDFAFELRCLELLNKFDFKCEHGGGYTDPVTAKSRQFDIRASHADGPKRVRCAIECKNLKPSNPLLMLSIPREEHESFHEVVVADTYRGSIEFNRRTGKATSYSQGDAVGKSCAQVGRDVNGVIVGNDSELYEKWGQALASANDLAAGMVSDAGPANPKINSLLLPVLVVPDNTLWQAVFDSAGAQTQSPIAVHRCQMFIGRNYRVGSIVSRYSVTVSHLEFVTVTGLRNLMTEVLHNTNRVWFPE